jgi:hypothetical protein
MSLSTTVTDLYIPDQTLFFTGESARLRWAILPCEAQYLLSSFQQQKVRRHHPPLNPLFKPKTYPVRKPIEEHNIGSLHGGVIKVQNPTFLIPLSDMSSKQSIFTQEPPKNVPTPSGAHRKWIHPLSGFWSKEKMSKSNSTAALAAIIKSDDEASFHKSQSDDFDQVTADWNLLSKEEKMVSYLMREYIITNKERLLNHYD